MEEVAKHYGNTILVIVIFILLALLLAWLLKADNDSFVAQSFQAALQNFFTRMNGVIPEA